MNSSVPNTFTRTTAMKTVTLGLNDFVGKYGLTDWGATFSMITITILPTFIFYFLTSKYMMSGLTAGAVKDKSTILIDLLDNFRRLLCINFIINLRDSGLATVCLLAKTISSICFHQRDTRKPGPFGEPFGWDLAVNQ
jgi:hypothetical protein